MYFKTSLMSKKVQAAGAVIAGGVVSQLTGSDIIGAITEIYLLYTVVGE